MTTTEEKMKVMQAHLDGLEIELRLGSHSNWEEVKKGPLWNWNDFDYRIKPKEKTLEERIQEKWPDKEVVMLEWGKVPSFDRDLLQMCGHINHAAAQSMRGFSGYVYLSAGEIHSLLH